jgi:cell division protein FtsB
MAAGLAILILWLLWLLFGIVRKEEIARHAVADTRAELAALASREATLRQNLDELDTPRGQEATLRETYGVAKPGEGVIIVVPPKEATTTPELPWWRKFLGWFHL